MRRERRSETEHELKNKRTRIILQELKILDLKIQGHRVFRSQLMPKVENLQIPADGDMFVVLEAGSVGAALVMCVTSMHCATMRHPLSNLLNVHQSRLY